MLIDQLGEFGFRVIAPQATMGPDRRYRYQRADGSFVRFIETAQFPLERVNSDFGTRDEELKALLDPVLSIKKMSRIAIGATLQRAVSCMDDADVFVNVGVWHGFSYLAAIAGNDDKACVGIDNFSEFGGPKAAFIERFLARRSASHRFYDQDYLDFFAGGLDRQIGVYIYDGEHSYANQYRGLTVADPFFSENAVIVVDDTNLERARAATLQFAEDSRHAWRIVIDQRTSGRRHITLWNGIMLMVRAPSALGEHTVDWSTTTSATNGGSFVAECPPASEASLTVISTVTEPNVQYGGGPLEVIAAGGDADLVGLLEGSSGEHVLLVDRPVEITDAAVVPAIKAMV